MNFATASQLEVTVPVSELVQFMSQELLSLSLQNWRGSKSASAPAKVKRVICAEIRKNWRWHIWALVTSSWKLRTAIWEMVQAEVKEDVSAVIVRANPDGDC